MSIKIFCDSCEKELKKSDGFGQFNFFKKVILFNAQSGQTPQIQGQELYLCVDCCEKVLETFKNKKKEQ